MRRIAGVSLLAAWLTAAGCPSSGVRTNGPAPFTRLDAIELRAVPTALNWDDDPRPDGLRAEVFCYQVAPGGETRSAPVEGELEFLLYEGRLDRSRLAEAEPFRTWRFTATELRPCLIKRTGLWEYVVQLDWGDRVPTTSSVTLVVCHRPPQGKGTCSSPMSISMGAK